MAGCAHHTLNSLFYTFDPWWANCELYLIFKKIIKIIENINSNKKNTKQKPLQERKVV